MPFLSIVIPAFNEEERIASTLGDVLAYLRAQPYTWEVLVVDDGSSDKTAAVVSGWAKSEEQVRVETIPHSGKGWAVKRGMESATGQYRFMCDADLAMPIDQLGTFLRHMDDGYDIVIASRQIVGAKRVGEPAIRHVIGRMFNWAVRLLALGGFEDTQCGFKCFRAEVAAELFSRQRTRGFGFDVEILYMAGKKGLRVLEIPVEWHHQESSKVRLLVDSFLMLRDTVMLRLRDQTQETVSPSNQVWQKRERDSAVGENGAGGGGAARLAVKPLVTVVVPTYNEAENLPQLVHRIFALGLPNVRMIVVDDGSPDGTGDVARGLARAHRGGVKVIQRDRKLGLGAAYVEGFKKALEGDADFVVQMDADLSHTPEIIPALLDALTEADVVVGSRYVKGGGSASEWGLSRRILSSLGNLGIRTLVGLGVKDATSGFKVFRAGVLRSLDLSQLRCKGFAFQAEMAKTCERRGYIVVEHPIKFEIRVQGRSKMSLGIVLEAFWCLLPLRWRRME